MSDSKFPVPKIQPLPDDPIHPSAVRLPVSSLAAERIPSESASADIALDLRCPRKTDVRAREEVYVTRRFLLSRRGAEALIQRLQEVLDQE